jgi:hypothetical protein
LEAQPTFVCSRLVNIIVFNYQSILQATSEQQIVVEFHYLQDSMVDTEIANVQDGLEKGGGRWKGQFKVSIYRHNSLSFSSDTLYISAVSGLPR